MKKTALTMGGFTQPNVAKSLIESPQAIEKGLVQSFLWLFPKPSYSNFSSLQKANQEFVKYVGMLCTLYISMHKLCMYAVYNFCH